MLLALDDQDAVILDAAAGALGQFVSLEARRREGGLCDLQSHARQQLGEQGWYGLAAREADGDAAYSAVAAVLFFREAGRIAGPMDILSTCLAAACVDDPDIGSAITKGERAVALAIADDAANPSTINGSPEATWRLLGGGPQPELAVFVTPEVTHCVGLDNTVLETLYSLDPVTSMRRVATGGFERLGENKGSRLWRFGMISTAAMLTGAAEATLDMIVQYARVRETFDRPIGSYQAVRHPCADMAVRLEAAKSQLWYAAAAMDAGHPDIDLHLSAAKYLANTAAVQNADWNIQLHGGIGITEEHDAHVYLKHSMLVSRVFGQNRAVLENILPHQMDGAYSAREWVEA